MLGADTGPHAFVADLDHPALEPDDHHHLRRVLRVRDGDRLTVSDGAGRWRACRFGDALEPDGAIHAVAAAHPRLAVGFALVKGERPELVVQKLTELGIDRIVPFTASRSVVHWDAARAHKQLDRLRRVAREASMQSRRCHLPDVAPLGRFADLVVGPGVVRAEQHGAPLSTAVTMVLIGPEGGWSGEERAAVPATVGLGAHVLRAETAAFAAGTLLAALRGGLVAPIAPADPDPQGDP